jgi:hypothetical protein
MRPVSHVAALCLAAALVLGCSSSGKSAASDAAAVGTTDAATSATAPDWPGRADGALPVAPPVTEVPSLRFAKDMPSALLGTFQDTFLISEVHDIIAVVALADASGPRVLRIDIVNPSGVLYQTMYRAFATGAQRGDTVPHPTTGIPIQVMATWTANGVMQLPVAIPVAGTGLTRHGLVGLYEIRVSIDGVPLLSGAVTLGGQP